MGKNKHGYLMHYTALYNYLQSDWRLFFHVRKLFEKKQYDLVLDFGMLYSKDNAIFTMPFMQKMIHLLLEASELLLQTSTKNGILNRRVYMTVQNLAMKLKKREWGGFHLVHLKDAIVRRRAANIFFLIHNYTRMEEVLREIQIKKEKYTMTQEEEERLAFCDEINKRLRTARPLERPISKPQSWDSPKIPLNDVEYKFRSIKYFMDFRKKDKSLEDEVKIDYYEMGTYFSPIGKRKQEKNIDSISPTEKKYFFIDGRLVYKKKSFYDGVVEEGEGKEGESFSKQLILIVPSNFHFEFVQFGEENEYCLCLNFRNNTKFLLFYRGVLIECTDCRSFVLFKGSSYMMMMDRTILYHESDLCGLLMFNRLDETQSIAVLPGEFFVVSRQQEEYPNTHTRNSTLTEILYWKGKDFKSFGYDAEEDDDMRKSSRFGHKIKDERILKNSGLQVELVSLIFENEKFDHSHVHFVMGSMSEWVSNQKVNIHYYDPIHRPEVKFCQFSRVYQRFVLNLLFLNQHERCVFNGVPKDVLLYGILPYLTETSMIESEVGYYRFLFAMNRMVDDYLRSSSNASEARNSNLTESDYEELEKEMPLPKNNTSEEEEEEEVEGEEDNKAKGTRRTISNFKWMENMLRRAMILISLNVHLNRPEVKKRIDLTSSVKKKEVIEVKETQDHLVEPKFHDIFEFRIGEKMVRFLKDFLDVGRLIDVFGERRVKKTNKFIVSYISEALPLHALCFLLDVVKAEVKRITKKKEEKVKKKKDEKQVDQKQGEDDITNVEFTHSSVFERPSRKKHKSFMSFSFSTARVGKSSCVIDLAPFYGIFRKAISTYIHRYSDQKKQSSGNPKKKKISVTSSLSIQARCNVIIYHIFELLTLESYFPSRKNSSNRKNISMEALDIILLYANSDLFRDTLRALGSLRFMSQNGFHFNHFKRMLSSIFEFVTCFLDIDVSEARTNNNKMKKIKIPIGERRRKICSAIVTIFEGVRLKKDCFREDRVFTFTIPHQLQTLIFLLLKRKVFSVEGIVDCSSIKDVFFPREGMDKFEKGERVGTLNCNTLIPICFKVSTSRSSNFFHNSGGGYSNLRFEVLEDSIEYFEHLIAKNKENNMNRRDGISDTCLIFISLFGRCFDEFVTTAFFSLGNVVSDVFVGNYGSNNDIFECATNGLFRLVGCVTNYSSLLFEIIKRKNIINREILDWMKKKKLEKKKGRSEKAQKIEDDDDEVSKECNTLIFERLYDILVFILNISNQERGVNPHRRSLENRELLTSRHHTLRNVVADLLLFFLRKLDSTMLKKCVSEFVIETERKKEKEESQEDFSRNNNNNSNMNKLLWNVDHDFFKLLEDYTSQLFSKKFLSACGTKMDIGSDATVREWKDLDRGIQCYRRFKEVADQINESVIKCKISTSSIESLSKSEQIEFGMQIPREYECDQIVLDSFRKLRSFITDSISKDDDEGKHHLLGLFECSNEFESAFSKLRDNIFSFEIQEKDFRADLPRKTIQFFLDDFENSFREFVRLISCAGDVEVEMREEELRKYQSVRKKLTNTMIFIMYTFDFLRTSFRSISTTTKGVKGEEIVTYLFVPNYISSKGEDEEEGEGEDFEPKFDVSSECLEKIYSIVFDFYLFYSGYHESSEGKKKVEVLDISHLERFFLLNTLRKLPIPQQYISQRIEEFRSWNSSNSGEEEIGKKKGSSITELNPNFKITISHFVWYFLRPSIQDNNNNNKITSLSREIVLMEVNRISKSVFEIIQCNSEKNSMCKFDSFLKKIERSSLLSIYEDGGKVPEKQTKEEEEQKEIKTEEEEKEIYNRRLFFKVHPYFELFMNENEVFEDVFRFGREFKGGVVSFFKTKKKEQKPKPFMGSEGFVFNSPATSFPTFQESTYFPLDWTVDEGEKKNESGDLKFHEFEFGDEEKPEQILHKPIHLKVFTSDTVLVEWTIQRSRGEERSMRRGRNWGRPKQKIRKNVPRKKVKVIGNKMPQQQLEKEENVAQRQRQKEEGEEEELEPLFLRIKSEVLNPLLEVLDHLGDTVHSIPQGKKQEKEEDYSTLIGIIKNIFRILELRERLSVTFTYQIFKLLNVFLIDKSHNKVFDLDTFIENSEVSIFMNKDRIRRRMKKQAEKKGSVQRRRRTFPQTKKMKTSIFHLLLRFDSDLLIRFIRYIFDVIFGIIDRMFSDFTSFSKNIDLLYEKPQFKWILSVSYQFALEFFEVVGNMGDESRKKDVVDELINSIFLDKVVSSIEKTIKLLESKLAIINVSRPNRHLRHPRHHSKSGAKTKVKPSNMMSNNHILFFLRILIHVCDIRPDFILEQKTLEMIQYRNTEDTIESTLNRRNIPEDIYMRMYREMIVTLIVRKGKEEGSIVKMIENDIDFVNLFWGKKRGNLHEEILTVLTQEGGIDDSEGMILRKHFSTDNKVLEKATTGTDSEKSVLLDPDSDDEPKEETSDNVFMLPSKEENGSVEVGDSKKEEIDQTTPIVEKDFKDFSFDFDFDNEGWNNNNDNNNNNNSDSNINNNNNNGNNSNFSSFIFRYNHNNQEGKSEVMKKDDAREELDRTGRNPVVRKKKSSNIYFGKRRRKKRMGRN